MKEVVSKVGYARSTIYALIKEGHFPKPFKLVPNGRANGWLEETIDNWMQDRASKKSSETYHRDHH
ncbi:MAG: transcriptional regulator [Rickettsiales bacterium]|nr:transcriptional regulator [Rickettsiales bacterium]|tara:strand:+ start:139 stop:336 length:198 start_codon:yes stop_codon:yes gene_type:complete